MQSRGKLQSTIALLAVVFGVVTVAAGARVLLGADPGYTVYLPLLGFNTAMGIAYVAVGILTWRSLRVGMLSAATIFAVNLLVLAAIGYLFFTSGGVALESLKAMTFRTAVWLLFLLALAWAGRTVIKPT